MATYIEEFLRVNFLEMIYYYFEDLFNNIYVEDNYFNNGLFKSGFVGPILWGED